MLFPNLLSVNSREELQAAHEHQVWTLEQQIAVLEAAVEEERQQLAIETGRKRFARTMRPRRPPAPLGGWREERIGWGK